MNTVIKLPKSCLVVVGTEIVNMPSRFISPMKVIIDYTDNLIAVIDSNYNYYVYDGKVTPIIDITQISSRSKE